MAFYCVLYRKEECDGCGACDIVRRERLMLGNEDAFSDWEA